LRKLRRFAGRNDAVSDAADLPGQAATRRVGPDQRAKLGKSGCVRWSKAGNLTGRGCGD